MSKRSNRIASNTSLVAPYRALDQGGSEQPSGPEHLTLEELADWARCSTRTISRLMETGQGPPVVRLSDRRLIFRLADARDWIEARCSRKPTEAAARRHRSIPERQAVNATLPRAAGAIHPK
jgi:predicted DNA-binding transcriptional regulator AlpA